MIGSTLYSFTKPYQSDKMLAACNNLSRRYWRCCHIDDMLIPEFTDNMKLYCNLIQSKSPYRSITQPTCEKNRSQ